MTGRARPEQIIQKAVFAHLRWRGAPNVFTFHPANGGYRTPIEAAIFKAMGVVAGTPDVICIKRGQVFALELKADGGQLTNTQRETIETMQRAGAVVAVAHGVDEAITQLENWQLLRRDRNFAQMETAPNGDTK
jgi:VRR-NUC domain